MKKSNLFAGLIGLALATFGFSSCADDDHDAPKNNNAKETLTSTATPTDMADYTIVVYGCGGGNLDAQLIDAFYQGYSAFGKKVKMAGVFKASSKVLQAAKSAGIKGTRYFEIKPKDGVTDQMIKQRFVADSTKLAAVWDMEDGKAKDAAVEQCGKNYYIDFCNDFYTADCGEDNLDLSDPNNIADAIKLVVKNNPAKKYIFMTLNHGGGWMVNDDVPTTTSRGMVFDDNNKDKNNDDIGISLDQLNYGVQKSGVKFEALFCNLCLMAYIENLTGYQQNFKFCLASAEMTKGCYYDQLANRLAKAGADISDDELYNQLVSWVKNGEYKNDWHKFSYMKANEDTDTQDMGVYDLRKMSTLTDAAKNISEWYTTAYDNAAYKKVINAAVLSSNYVMATGESVDDSYLKCYNDRVAFSQSLGYQPETLVQMIAYDNNIKDVNAAIKKLSEKDKKYLLRAMNYGITLSHFVRTTIQEMKKKGLDNDDAAKLSKLYNNYQNALKSMCYIKCSHDDAPDMDAYVWTSPTITLHTLNSTAYNDKVLTVDAAKTMDASHALASYRNTKFDQETGWSKFLQKLTVTPSIMTNPIRSTALYDKVFGKK